MEIAAADDEIDWSQNSLCCFHRLRRLRRGRRARTLLAEATQTESPGRAGGGRPARWNAQSSRASSRSLARRGYRRRRDHAYLRRARLRRPRHRVPVAALGRDARSHRPRGGAPRLGVDMATGTGWPFGGPEVSAAQGSSSARARKRTAARQADGHEGEARRTGRRGPGAGSLRDRCARRLPRPLHARASRRCRAVLVRGQFHDSFEYYQASWTPRLAAEFQQLHGYDFQKYAAELMGKRPSTPIRWAASRATTGARSRSCISTT